MSITLSSAEIEKLTSAIRLLLSPLDHASVDHWRAAVNRELTDLLHADSAGFLLPVPEGLAMYSEEHDPRELAKYTQFPPPPLPGGKPVYVRAAELGVSTPAELYERQFPDYLRSVYYNEYQAPNRAYDPLVLAVGPGGPCAGATAALQFWHDRPDGTVFGSREAALLRLLLPAFHAGVESQMRWGKQHQDLLDTLDSLNQPVLVCNRAGKVLHLTASLHAVLDEEPEAERLRGELLATASELCKVPREGSRGASLAGHAAREVGTHRARYRLSGCLYGGPHASQAAYVLVSVDRLTPIRRSNEEMQAAFALTPAETRVALLLALGKSNAEIARELFLSPHTVRRHTERVLHKMKIGSRAEVAARLYV